MAPALHFFSFMGLGTSRITFILLLVLGHLCLQPLPVLAQTVATGVGPALKCEEIFSALGLGKSGAEKISPLTPQNFEILSTEQLFSALSAFRDSPDLLSEDFSRKWAQAAIPKLKSYDPNQLTAILFSFGKIKFNPGAKFLDEWQKVTISKINAFGARELANSLYSFSKMGVIPNAHLMEFWMLAADGKIQDFKADDLTVMLSAFARLSFEPSAGFFESWYSTATKKIYDFRSQQLSHVIFSFYLLGTKRLTWAKPFLARFLELNSGSEGRSMSVGI